MILKENLLDKWNPSKRGMLKSAAGARLKDIDPASPVPEIGLYMRRVESINNDTDEDLVLLAAGGDTNAFEQLMLRYLPGLASMSRRMLGDETEAEDVAQDTFLRLWNHAANFDPDKARLSTWLYRVAGNLCIDRLRKRKTQGIQEPLEFATDIGEPAEQDYKIASQQLSLRVDRAIQSLPERQRYALVLCHYQGLRMKEASRIMDVSVDALESLLARARRGLKKELENEWRLFLPESGE